jgi:FdrA protein
MNHVEVRPGAYADSVTLLQVSRAVASEPGVDAAMVAMATPLNLDLLVGMGFESPAAGPNDMVLALRIGSDGDLDAALATVDAALTAARRTPAPGAVEAAPPRTTAAALRDSDATLALVSVPGPHAFVEAMDALAADRDVMVFSDNVPLEQEIRLKTEAARRDRLVMGPDCGTAVVGGLGLGFANAVRPGPVGVVAASGTGCQQLLCLLDAAGVGITAAFGVGGRDLSEPVGGASTRQAMRRLDADPATELIVVVSKPPSGRVADELAAFAEALATPVEFVLLGPGEPDLTAGA